MEPPRPWAPPRPLPLPLVTERLTIDVWRPLDAPSLWEAIDTSRSSLIPWLPWAASGHRDPEETLERIEAWTRQWTAPEPTDVFLGLRDRATDAIVGMAGFHQIVPELLQAEIGYWVREERRNQGLCSEAVRALVTSGFRDWGFRRITVECAGLNVPSRRVVEKAGLPLEACFKDARWIDGLGWSDSLVFGVLATEWDLAAGTPRPGLPARRS